MWFFKDVQKRLMEDTSGSIQGARSSISEFHSIFLYNDNSPFTGCPCLPFVGCMEAGDFKGDANMLYDFIAS